MQSGQLAQAQQAARFLGRAEPRKPPNSHDAARLIDLAERQIQAGRAADALELWNTVSAPLDPVHGPVLSNPNLVSAPGGLAFDWQLPHCDGIAATWQPSLLTFLLSGDQPDSCVLLEQVVPLAKDAGYRLQFQIQH